MKMGLKDKYNNAQIALTEYSILNFRNSLFPGYMAFIKQMLSKFIKEYYFKERQYLIVS